MANTTYDSTARSAADEVSRLGNEAENVVSDIADGVADVASRVQDRASVIGKRAVDQFKSTTDYFREHDAKDMVDDLNSWVKAHPTQALLAAAALGFVAAAWLRRR